MQYTSSLFLSFYTIPPRRVILIRYYQTYLESYLNDFILDLLIYLLRMSTTEQSSTHVSLSIPLDQPPPSDNFQFMSDTFTLPQDGHSGPTQTASSQGYAG